MKNTRFKYTALLLAASALMGCVEPGDPVYGASFTTEQFKVYDASVGVYPSELVLEDPNNMFRTNRSGRSTRFEIEANDETNVSAFYSWATWLATEPTGESQFFAAANLAEIWQAGNASQTDLLVIRQMAIDGFLSVLNNFPDAVVFDASGTTAFELLTPSYLSIIDLGGTPPVGWVILEDTQGRPRAVRQ